MYYKVSNDVAFCNFNSLDCSSEFSLMVDELQSQDYKVVLLTYKRSYYVLCRNLTNDTSIVFKLYLEPVDKIDCENYNEFLLNEFKGQFFLMYSYF